MRTNTLSILGEGYLYPYGRMGFCYGPGLMLTWAGLGITLDLSPRRVMAAPTINVSAEENLGDPIEIRVDVVHPAPVATVVFPAAIIMRTLAQHGEAIRGIQDHLLGMPIQEELTALRFRVDVVEVENASLRTTIRTMEAIERVTRNHKRLAHTEIERQLASVQESHRQDREDFKKLKELMISQFGHRS
ncbi:hypothetical protein Tco_1354020 [Tanacetum coccineum]